MTHPLLSPIVSLVALQFLLHALGWALGAWMLPGQRRALLSWSAFLALVGLGFVLMTMRDEDRSWWALNGAALCWTGGLLMLWRGLAWHFGATGGVALQRVLALVTLAVQAAFGPGLEQAPTRVVFSYVANLAVVAAMLAQLYPLLQPRLGSRWSALLVVSPAVVIIIAFALQVVRQLLDPSKALELHRFDPDNLRSLYAYLVAVSLFSFTFMALVVAQLLSQLRTLSERDALTGLHNRRALTDRLAAHWAAWHRDRHGFALLLVDVDHFKRVNDTHGHQVGDAVLVQTAERLRTQVRAQDCVARFGGEEFVVLMPNASEAEAKALAGRLHRAMHEAPLAAGALALPMTISIGVAAVRADDADADGLLRRADAALYKAKAGGRDRVVVAP